MQRKIIGIDAYLHPELKAIAALEGKTVQEFVSDLIRADMEARKRQKIARDKTSLNDLDKLRGK